MLTSLLRSAISGGRNDVALYREIIAALRTMATACSPRRRAEHVTASGEALDSRAIFERDLPGSPSATPSSPSLDAVDRRRLRDRHRSLRFGIR